MRPTPSLLSLAALTGLLSGPLRAETIAVLSEADRAIGDTRHKLEIITAANSADRIAIVCNIAPPKRITVAVSMARKEDWPPGDVALELLRIDGETRSFILRPSLNLLIAANDRAIALSKFALASAKISLRAGDGTTMGLDLRSPRAAPGLARFRTLCEL